MAQCRRLRVSKLLLEIGWRRCRQTTIARLLGVGRSTISRDVKLLDQRYFAILRGDWAAAGITHKQWRQLMAARYVQERSRSRARMSGR